MSRKVRLGFIGAGSITGMHLRNLKDVKEAKIVAFADPNIDSAKHWAEQAGLKVREGKTVFADWREMLDKVELDAAIILSPHSVHCEQILTALDRGLHVLTEKPMVVKVSEARKVIMAAKKSGKVVVVGYQRRFMPQFRFIREQVIKGNFGELNFIEAFVGQGWQRGTANTWRQDPKLSGGGFLMDTGSHIVDIVLWTAQAKPAQVTATISNNGAPVEINDIVGIQFSDGSLASIVAVGSAISFFEHHTFVFDEGVIRLEQGKVSIGTRKKDQLWGAEWREVEPSEMPPSSNPDRHFIDVVLGRTENESPPEDALKVIVVTEAAYKSAATGQAVKVRL
ncbi:MAG: Gfo/Idh/MocA family oxidoreductase [Armatimonadetes bacterium]|nr:Gfo/Idh/MocA family oxidoreductase [Armatimonadota bacterium]